MSANHKAGSRDATRRAPSRGRRRATLSVAAIFLLASITVSNSGCVTKPDPIPRYERTDLTDSLATLRQRMAALHTVRGEATITLTSATGRGVNLDAAYVLAPPARARLRAWKFGQAVFDLTIDGDKAWAYLPREEARPAAPGLRRSLGRWLALLGGGEHAFDGDAKILGDTIEITRPEPPAATLRITIDRATLTPRRFAVRDADHELFELTLADYRPVGDGQVWPMTIVATQFGPLRGSRTSVVEVRSRDVDINAELDDAAFKPPARAEALP